MDVAALFDLAWLATLLLPSCSQPTHVHDWLAASRFTERCMI
jgi:hypothetical protein